MSLKQNAKICCLSNMSWDFFFFLFFFNLQFTLLRTGKDCNHGDRALIMICKKSHAVKCVHLYLAPLQQVNRITLVMHFTFNGERLTGKCHPNSFEYLNHTYVCDHIFSLSYFLEKKEDVVLI